MRIASFLNQRRRLDGLVGRSGALLLGGMIVPLTKVSGSNSCGNPLEGIVRRAGNVVKDTDGPGWTTWADPIHDCFADTSRAWSRGRSASGSTSSFSEVMGTCLDGESRISRSDRVSSASTYWRSERKLFGNGYLRLLHLDVLEYCGG